MLRKEMVLNELSWRLQATDLYAARQRMERLVATILAAVRQGARRVLRATESIEGVLLAPEYSMARWRNDGAVNRELRSYFRTISSKAPVLTLEDAAHILDRDSRSEFRYAGQQALGLGGALLLDALALSLTSERCWMCERIVLDVTYLEDDGEFVEEKEEVRHASRPEDVAPHGDWLAGRDLPVLDGADLWRRREQLFPNLRFCEAVEKGLLAVDAGHPLLRQILKRLEELNQYFQVWDGGRFEPAAIPMKITSESSSTAARYAEERRFLCPDGVARDFRWHGRLTPGAWRIYFEPHASSRGAFIGYIGKKPASTLYPT